MRYPILPKVTRERYGASDCNDCVRDFYRIRHHSLFAPCDFDISPYFAVVKPTLAAAADYWSITWVEEGERPPEFIDEPEDAEQAA